MIKGPQVPGNCLLEGPTKNLGANAIDPNCKCSEKRKWDPSFVSLTQSVHHRAWHLEGEPSGLPVKFLDELWLTALLPKEQPQMPLRVEAATRWHRQMTTVI